MIDLGSFGGYSAAFDINDSDVAVGLNSDSVTGFAFAALWANGQIRAICGNVESEANGINNLGQVVGWLFTGTADRAFVFAQNTLSELGTLPTGQNSVAYAINSSGQIVGNSDVIASIEVLTNSFTGQIYYQTNYEDHAFLSEAGVMTDLNELMPCDSGWDLNFANDINERGQIVGYGTVDGNYHAYVLTPIGQAMQQLISMVNQSGVVLRVPLTATLKAALVSINQHNFVAAANQLRAFERQVAAQVAPANPVLAQTLVRAAQQVINALKCHGSARGAASPHAVKRLRNCQGIIPVPHQRRSRVELLANPLLAPR
jgi:probable HAF family extracellular repeat protein